SSISRISASLLIRLTTTVSIVKPACISMSISSVVCNTVFTGPKPVLVNDKLSPTDASIINTPKVLVWVLFFVRRFTTFTSESRELPPVSTTIPETPLACCAYVPVDPVSSKRIPLTSIPIYLLALYIHINVVKHLDSPMLKSSKSSENLIIRIENKVCPFWHHNEYTHVFVRILKMLNKMCFTVFFNKATIHEFLKRTHMYRPLCI